MNATTADTLPGDGPDEPDGPGSRGPEGPRGPQGPDGPAAGPEEGGASHGARALGLGVLRAMAVPALALLTAMAVGGLVIVFTSPDTLEAWGDFFSDPLGALTASWEAVADAYRAMFETSLGSPSAVGRTLVEATPLMLTGLSVALAFRAGLFNIGAAGQLVIGATCAGWVGFTFDLPKIVHLPLAVAAGLAGGAAWAAIAGVLKARTGAHEVITTIMLNYVAYQLLAYALRTDAFQRATSEEPISPPTADSSHLPQLSLGELRVHLGLVLALVAAVAVWWLLERSTIGFRLRAVGANPSAARYAGIGVGAAYVLAMALAGGLAGLAGTVNILGRRSFSLTEGYYSELGFDGIAVALLGRANPAGVVGAAFLFGVLRSGSTGMQAQTSTPVDIIVVIQALIILFVAAPALVRAVYRLRVPRGGERRFTTSWGA